MPKFSIITVTYQDQKNLETTVKSISDQKYPDKEFIVIDGGSTDGTIELVREYASLVTHFISEPDKGIYDAMNKGIKIASGKWLVFMNAGDVFASATVLSEIGRSDFSQYALLYGSTVRQRGVVTPAMDPAKSLPLGFIMACHQSMFFNRNLLGNELYYNLDFALSGDYDLVSRIYNNQYKIHNIELPISNFLGNGKTTKRTMETRVGRYRAIVQNFGIKALITSIVSRSLGNRYPVDQRVKK